MRWLFTFGCALLLLHSSAQQPSLFQDDRLDTLLARMVDRTPEAQLILIDHLLLDVGSAVEPRVLYFLRRYRSEALYYQGLMNESMVDAEKTHRIALALHDDLLIACSCNQVAVLLQDQGDSKGAVELLRRALRLYPVNAKSNYPLTQLYRIHGNMGLCWADIGRSDSAMVSQRLSFKLAEQAGSPRGEALALMELGRCMLGSGDVEQALYHFQTARRTATTNGIRDVQLECIAAVAEALLQIGREREALEILIGSEAEMLLEDGTALRSVMTFYERKARMLEAMRLHEEAMRAITKWDAMDSSLVASSALAAQRTLATIHATDAALSAERERIDLADAELRSENRIRWMVIIGGSLSILLGAFLVVVFISRGRQRAKLQRLAVQRMVQDRHIADLQIREQVSADLHDDIGAGLSALKLHCELSAELIDDPIERERSAKQASQAGDLIASLRHLLWSFDHSEANVQLLAQYIIDRARMLCVECERPLSVTCPDEWPDLATDASIRHSAWPQVKKALLKQLDINCNDPVVLTLSYDNGLAVCVDGPQGHDDLNFRLIARMPAQRINKVVSVFLLLMTCSAQPVVAQHDHDFHHAVLDSLFSPRNLSDRGIGWSRAINVAILNMDLEGEPALACHLLLARANSSYYQGLFEVGLRDTDRALKAALHLQDSLLIATTYNMFGLLHEDQENPAVTLAWFRLAKQWLPPDTRCNYPVVKDYHLDGNIAACFVSLGQQDSAVFHFRRSLTSASNDHNERAMALANLGLAHERLSAADHNAAQDYLEAARQLSSHDGSRDVFSETEIEQARMIAMRDGTDAGATALVEATKRTYAEDHLTSADRRDFMHRASDLYVELGRVAEALEAWRDFHKLDSTIQAENNHTALSTLKLMLDDAEQLENERTRREQAQTLLALQRSQRNVMIASVGGCALLLLAIALAYAGRYRNKGRLTALEMERATNAKELAELQVRRRVNGELDLELGAGLSDMKRFNELALSREQNKQRRDHLTYHNALIDGLLGSMQQIIWALDTSGSTVSKAVAYTADHACTYAAQHGLKIHLTLHTEWPDMELDVVQRRNLFLVVKEALHNTVKHAKADQLELRLAWKNGIVGEIQDNGCGFGPSGLSSGNGMGNMRRRMEAVGGSFSASGTEGTCIRFTIPMSALSARQRQTSKRGSAFHVPRVSLFQ